MLSIALEYWISSDEETTRPFCTFVFAKKKGSLNVKISSFRTEGLTLLSEIQLHNTKQKCDDFFQHLTSSSVLSVHNTKLCEFNG